MNRGTTTVRQGVGMDNRELFYNRIAANFEQLVNPYDTRRRLEAVFDDFLGSVDLTGLKLLDGGCGAGFFTAAAQIRHAEVYALDIAGRLVASTSRKVPGARGVTGSLLALPFPAGLFDVVISSDVIEHTPDPYRATRELIRVLKPGGWFCLTVPNRSAWYFSLILAQWLRLRPYRGYENWVRYGRYRRFLDECGIELIQYKGIHLFPFVIGPLNGLLRWLDRRLDRRLGPLMVNIAACGRKRPGAA